MLAYFDPVSGTIILQAIIAGAIGTVAFFRKWLWKMFCACSNRETSKERQHD